MSNRGTPLSLGQFAEFSAAVIRNLPRDINPDIVLGWAKNGESLARTLRKALCPPRTRLRRVGTVLIPVVVPVKGTPKVTLSVFELTEPMTDDEILTELGEGHAFGNSSIAKVYIDWLLTRQKNGEKGDLATKGPANILYICGMDSGIYARNSRRGAAFRSWCMHGFRLNDGDFRWEVGCRVFSAAAGA